MHNMVAAQKNILIIEDSPTQRAILRNLCVELGFAPICPTRFDHSVTEIIKNEDITLVLLDLILLDDDGSPLADGFQLCDEIKSLDPQVKIIVISAESDDAAQQFAAAQGADTFIGKPFKIEELESKIKSLGIKTN